MSIKHLKEKACADCSCSDGFGGCSMPLADRPYACKLYDELLVEMVSEKKVRQKGFTVAELLVVVAIIAVLTAIAVPTFTGQLERSKEAADLSNIRSAYADAVAKYIDSEQVNTSVAVPDVKLSSSGALDKIDASDLPFDLPDDLNITKGTYSVTFDFSGSRPRATLALSE